MTVVKRVLRTIINIGAILGIAFVIARLAFIALFIIPSGSMYPTLEVGDRLVGEFFLHDYEIGDIVTFTNPEDSKSTLVKRIVAVEGETVDLVNGELYVNGEPRVIEEAVGRTEPFSEHASNLTENVTFPLTVPEGCVFVMGDNRENSADSRFFGCINTSRITSEIIFRISPLERFGFVE